MNEHIQSATKHLQEAERLFQLLMAIGASGSKIDLDRVRLHLEMANTHVNLAMAGGANE